MPTYYYLDASATLKLYLTNELGTDFMRILLEDAAPNELFFISTFGVLEIDAAIRRRIRDDRLMYEALRLFIQDLVRLFRVIPTSDRVLHQAMSVVENHRLRAGDAIHLATALDIAAIADDSRVFMVSSDSELLEASEAAGIGALDPQANDAIDSLRQIRAV